MTTPKHNKFSKGKTSGFFPFNQWRFITDNHPVITSKENAPAKQLRRYSALELQMLDGFANMFQCDEREAIRIALYEASRSASEAYELAFRFADTKATDKAHQGRSSKKQWNLPKSEKDKASEAAKEIGITDAEFIRLAIIWLRNGIRSDSIKKFANSKRIAQDDVARQWSRNNQGKPPNEQVASFKKALMEAQALFDYMDEIKLDEWQEKKNERRKVNWPVRKIIDHESATYDIEQTYWFEKLLEGEAEEELKAQLAYACMRNWQLDWDTAILIVEDDCLDMKNPNKMKPMDKLRLIKMGRAKAAKPGDDERAKRWRLEEVREEKAKDWGAYVESLPKTWGAFVMSERLCKKMIGRPDPFPDLPNPLPRDFPKPEDWNPEHVSTDFKRDDIFYG